MDNLLGTEATYATQVSINTQNGAIPKVDSPVLLFQLLCDEKPFESAFLQIIYFQQSGPYHKERAKFLFWNCARLLNIVIEV